MLHLFEANSGLFSSWQVVRYEQEGDAYMLQLKAVLQDDSRLEMRDYLFADGSWVVENFQDQAVSLQLNGQQLEVGPRDWKSTWQP